MTNRSDLGGTFTFPGISITVTRMGYGAMQLAGRDGHLSAKPVSRQLALGEWARWPDGVGPWSCNARSPQV